MVGNWLLILFHHLLVFYCHSYCVVFLWFVIVQKLVSLPFARTMKRLSFRDSKREFLSVNVLPIVLCLFPFREHCHHGDSFRKRCWSVQIWPWEEICASCRFVPFSTKKICLRMKTAFGPDLADLWQVPCISEHFVSAATSSNYAALSKLLGFGADVNAKDRKGHSAMYYLLLDISPK